ncbi:SAM-dependent methyltransferase [Methanolapillus ohkumae]|uniref:RNA-binding S4 domain-containing protein n=1 Tax=Methanolapillus ohkumae TaxID=3028298 RepID=A0AA96V6A4_9EURY|nr:hypothetical protein MsAm2_04840 [Methanosarcinaceae archaeon Am2]
MRLDSYLVEMGFFKSRGRAKSAVEGGKVKLNDVVCSKASKNITTEDKIEVEEGLDMPKGYFKLQAIQEMTGILNPGDYVLDLGSSAGGFMLFALETVGPSGHVQGIEFSKDFRTELGKIAFEHKNAEIMFADVFTIPVEKVATPVNSKNMQFDVLLSDMTLEPKDSILALSRMYVLLKENGYLLQVVKIPQNRSKKSVLKKIEALGFHIIDVLIPKTQEAYIIAQKGMARPDGETDSDDLFEEFDDDESGEDDDDNPGFVDITDVIFDGEEED